MLTYIDTYRAGNWAVHERAGVGVESCLEVGSGCRMAEPAQEGEILSSSAPRRFSPASLRIEAVNNSALVKIRIAISPAKPR